MYLGGYPLDTFSGNFFEGLLDELSFYDRALSFGEVVALYESGSQGKCFSFGNAVPLVDAGSDSVLGSVSDTAALEGTAVDDQGIVFSEWVLMDGPGTVTFGDANALVTTAQFTTPGDYTLELTVFDAEGLSARDQVNVQVDVSCGTPISSGMLSWWRGENLGRGSLSS